MKILERLIGQNSLDFFLDNHFTRIPLAVPHGAKDFLDLVSWDSIHRIIDSKKAVLRIVKDGRLIKDYVDLTSAEAQKHYQQGETLLVRFAEKADEKLLNVSQDFAKSFHTPVDVQLYCTPAGHNAFGWHYDVEEVFILQLKGSKHYTIRPNTIHPNPLVTSIPKDLGYEQEKTPIEIQVTLEAGDFLYIPSGWWHVAQTRAESMHVSVGLMPSSALDILGHLPSYLAQNPWWRKRLPIHRTFSSVAEEVEFYKGAMGKLGKDLEKVLASPEFIQSFLTSRKKN